ncbi:MAG: caffeoyl-CoA O-methyltransferase [Cyclobacteriaceae bacterium]|jgi:caffeoyl-CoA O-methyltransferase
MEFLEKSLQDYVEVHTSPESPLLYQINRETHLEVLKPRMLSGHLQGRVLSMFSHMIQPDHILEIGTYTGYSAICLAEGLSENGQLITIDINDELEPRTKGYFESSGFGSKIEMIVGDARMIIPTLNQPWDLVFIDADKESYTTYFDLIIDKVRSGGFILIDNVLWSGKVFDENINDKVTVSVRDFNKKVHQDDRVENVLFPIRDGLMVLRKK